MAAFTKIIFSVVFLSAGFGLASLFGPPGMADRLAAAIRPDEAKPSWGTLQPLGQASLSDPSWADYESAAFTPLDAPGTTAPMLANAAASPAGEAPLWNPPTVSSSAAEPAWEQRNDPAVVTAVVESPAPRRFEVSTTAWRESTAPIGWPSSDPPADPSPPETAPPVSAASPFANQPFNNQPLNNQPLNSQPVDRQPTTPRERYAPAPEWPQAPATNDAWGSNPRPVAPPVGGGPYRPFGPPQSSITPIPVTPISELGADSELTRVDPPQSAAPAVAAPEEAVRHIVSDGDTLVRLAQRYLHDANRAGEIFQANQPMLTHPELLPIGAELVIPADQAVGGSISSPLNAASAASGAAPFARLLGPRPVGRP